MLGCGIPMQVNAAKAVASVPASGFRSLPGLTSTEAQIAAVLHTACPESLGQQLHETCEELIGLSEEIEHKILGELSPDEVAGESAVPLRIGVKGADILFGRLSSLRRTDRLVKASPSFITASSRGGGAGDPAGGFSIMPLRDSALGVFVQGRYQNGNRSRLQKDLGAGFGFENRSLTLGADYRFSDELTLGLAFSYQNVESRYQAILGGMKAENWKGALYGSYALPLSGYVAWVLDYTGIDYAVTRAIDLPKLVNQIRSNPAGHQYGFSLSLGKDWQIQEWEISPYFRVEYSRLDIGAYREYDNRNLALAFKGQTDDSLVTTLGSRISRAVSLPFGVLTPSLHCEWDHQSANDNRVINARFVALPASVGQFTSQTGTPDRNYFNVGGSLLLTLPGGNSAFLQYETRLGQTAISAHTVEAGIRFTF